jgi:hypothetical protein
MYIKHTGIESSGIIANTLNYGDLYVTTSMTDIYARFIDT